MLDDVMEDVEDTIYLRNLHVSATVGLDAWGRPSKPQPLVISVRLTLDTVAAGATDDINQTLSYGLICKEILSLVENEGPFPALSVLNFSIAKRAANWRGTKLQISIKALKASLRAEGGIECEMSFVRRPHEIALDDESSWFVSGIFWRMHDLRSTCIIGINPHEREKKQIVVINIRLATYQPNKQASTLERSHWARFVEDLTQASHNTLT